MPEFKEKKMEICKEVGEFAQRMQYKLDKNRYKACTVMNPKGEGRGWEQCKFGYLLKRISEEADELKIFLVDFCAMKADPDTDDQVLDDLIDDIKNECADVGNFAMMIHDNISKKLVTKNVTSEKTC